MSDSPLHSVSVAAVIFNDAHDQVLLIRRHDNGHWEPPGGVLELGETITDGLKREVREETGCDIEVEALTGAYKNMSRHIVALVFRSRATSQPAHRTDEADAVAWQPLDDVESLLAPAFAIRIYDAIGATARVRAHNGVQLLT